MEPRKQLRTRLAIEELENRAVPGTLIELGTQEEPPGYDQASYALLAANPSNDRPFHLEESGIAVINPDGTINASASGKASHLGAFTLNDSSTIVGMEVTPDGVVIQVDGDAHLEAANGDHLDAHFVGSVNLTIGVGTLNFEWTGGSGRFDDATGATVWHVNLNPDFTYTAVADGVINF